MKKITHFRKSLALIITVALLVMMVVPTFADTPVVTSSYAFANKNTYGYILALHPSASGAVSALAQTFNASVSGYLSSITVNMYRLGLPSGSVKCQLQGTGNNLAADPNGTVFETSSTVVDMAELDTDTNASVTFAFSSTYQIVADQKYAFVVYTYSLSYQDASNSTRIGRDAASPTAEGQQNEYFSSGWGGPYTGADLVYEVYVAGVLGGGGGGDFVLDSGEYGTVLNAFVSFMVPLIVTLMPAFLLMFLTRRVDKWLLLIGLTIGAGLGFYFGLVPLWLVFLISIGLIGMAYQSVRSGGNS